MKKFLLKIAVYSLVVFLIANAIALISLYFLGQSNLYKPQFVKNGVKEKHFDYVVLGSSTGLTTLDTKQIDSTLHTIGLNISIDDSALNTHYLMLQYFYQQQKTTDCLILSVTPWDLGNDNPVLSDNDYRFFSEQSTPVVQKYYQTIAYQGFPVLKYSRYMPFLGVGYYNTEVFYPSIFTILQPEKRNRFDDRGNYSYPTSGKPKDTPQQTIDMVVKNPYLGKIKDFCKKNNIKLLIYQSPLYKTKVNMSQNELTLNHSAFLQSKNLFYDNLHVNKMGRKICSEAFSKQFSVLHKIKD